MWATSRAGNDATARFPELAGLGDALGDVDALLDGEIVALDDAGVPELRAAPAPHAGRRRRPPSAGRVAEQPVVLHGVRRALARRPLDVRAARTPTGARCSSASRSPGPRGRPRPPRSAAATRCSPTAEQLGLEGVVAKRLDSPYLPGQRADAWRKVKPTHGQELVVGGWLPGRRAARRPARLAARRLPRPRRRAAARCGSRAASAPASTAPQRDRARDARLRPAAPRRRARSTATPRLPDPVWVEPEVVVEVAFHEWTSAGVLRAPRYRGLRDDKPAADVVRET